MDVPLQLDVYSPGGFWCVASDYKPLTVELVPCCDQVQHVETRSFLLFIRQDSWSISIDLSAAYLQVPIRLGFHHYLWFVCWRLVHQFIVLSLGLSTAPQIFTWVVALVSAILHKEGVCIPRYPDVCAGVWLFLWLRSCCFGTRS